MTSAATSAPVAGATVSIYSSTGSLAASTSTDAQGAYSFPGLPASSYFVRAVPPAGSGLEAQLYDAIICPEYPPASGCSITNGTPVTVTGSNPSPGINFALLSLGTITGVVTEARTGEPVAGATVYFYPTFTEYLMSSAVTDGDGAYESPGLRSASYAVYAMPPSSSGLTAQAYSGGARLVSAGQTTAHTDFVLVPGARITGTVRNASTLAPAANIPITFHRGGVVYGPSLTDSQGVYTSPGLLTGSYHVIANRTSVSGLVGQLHDNVVCPWGQCTLAMGKLVALTAPGVANVDFDLAPGGTITGTVINAVTLAPASGVEVWAYSSTGRSITSSTTDEQGAYTLRGLPTGSYFLAAYPPSNSGLVKQVYKNVPCPSSCPVTSGTPVAVTALHSTSINFALSALGAITGTVIDAATGAPVAGASVRAYPTNGVGVRSTSTDAQGMYVLNGLDSGDYFVRVLPRWDSTLLGEIYDNISCSLPSCPVTSGTPVTVTSPNVTSNINVALSQGGTIAGRVINALTSAPIANASVFIYSSSGERLSSAITDALGNYSSPGLPTGSYFLLATSFSSGLGLMRQVYSGISCPSFGACFVTSGTPVVVTGASATLGINFALSPWASITGTVTSAQSGAPVAATVYVYSNSGALLRSSTTNAQGVFTVDGLVTGSYFVRAQTSNAYLGELYDNIPCPDGICAVTSGTPVAAVAATATTVNFALTPGGTITGTVTNATTQTPVADVAVAIFTSDGQPVKSGFVNAEGSYSFSGLPTGSYFAAAFPPTSTNFVSQLYDNITCPFGGSCQVQSGTPVAVTAPNTTSGINFALSPAATITGTVINAVSKTPVPYVAVFAYSSDGTLESVAGTDTQGAYRLRGLKTGSYFVVAMPVLTPGFLSQIYDNIDCPLATDCSPENGTPVPVTDLQETPNINFALTPPGSITGTVINTLTSAPVPNTTVLVYSSAGVEVGSTSTNAQGAYTLSRLSTGSYFLLAEPPASTRLLAQLYDGIICPASSCSVTSGTPVAVAGPNATTVNFALSAPPFGQVDTPRPFSENTEYVMGAFAMTGWVLDDVGVTKVEIYRNCLGFEPANCQNVDGRSVVYIGDAAFLEGARPDVAAAFPGMPNNTRAGWGYLLLTPMLPQVLFGQPYGGYGPLTLFAFATDTHGNRRLLGRSWDPASVDSSTPTHIFMAHDLNTKPFGTIDTPGQGETVSGILNNFGWALTPDSNSVAGDPGDIFIPTDGSTMTVFIDGVPTAFVAYNQCRGTVGNPPPAGVFCNDDVSNIFGNPTPLAAFTTRTENPTKYRNLDAGRAAIGAFTIDTSTLSNGLHTLAWSVTDSVGRNEGTGSRFFIVANDAPAAAVSKQGSLDANRSATSASASAVSVLTNALPVTDGVFVRFGFDLAESWKPLRTNDNGKLAVRLNPLGRLELWLGRPVEAGYMVANGALQPLPVGTSLVESRFSWMPPPGYVGPYELVFVRGGERINVTVTVK